jgi:hypothetical protein
MAIEWQYGGETERLAIYLSCSARTYSLSVWCHDGLHLHLAPFHTRHLQSLQGRAHGYLRNFTHFLEHQA